MNLLSSIMKSNVISEFAKQQENLNIVKKSLENYGIGERLGKLIINHTGGNNTSIEKVSSFLASFDIAYFYNEVIPTVEEIEMTYAKKSQAVAILKERLEKKKCKKLMIDIAVEYLLDGQPMTTLVDELEEALKTVTQKENIVALQSLVNELAQDHAFLVKLDLEFCGDVLEKRPLVALLMMMNEQLRPLMERAQDELDAYIDNFDIYKQLLPYIKIQDGTTHGQWRHLVDPKKKCLVLTAKNCQIAASEQLNRTYGESDSKFLVLQGLSMKANDDNAEVHYLEV